MAASAPSATGIANQAATGTYAALTLVVASTHEAQALCQHYQLQQIDRCLWQGSYHDNQMQLLISGIGKSNTKKTMQGYLAQHQGNSAWLNVGIAWHHQLPIGTAVLAHSVRDCDDGDGKNWFPQIVFKPPCPCDDLHTTSTAKGNYPYTGLVDMESASFYAQAISNSSTERVHCLKVVSDNPTNKITANEAKQQAPQLMQNALPTIDSICESLCELNRVLAKRDPNIELPECGHSTTSERRELKLRLCQWQHLFPGQPPPQADSAAKLLAKLRSGMQSAMQP